MQSVLLERWNVLGLRKDNLKKVIVSADCFFCVPVCAVGNLKHYMENQLFGESHR